MNVIVSVPDVTNKALSRESNYIVDVIMRPKFGNFSISMREVIKTSILQVFDQKSQFFWKGCACFKFNDLVNVAKELRQNVKMFCGLNSMF